MKYTIYIETLGCSKNQVDSEIMMGLLQRADYRLVVQPELAEIIVVNTCGFIESAKEESIDTILEMSHYKTLAKCKFLVVTGCLAQRYIGDLTHLLPEVDAFIGTASFDEIVKVIALLEDSQAVIARTDDVDKILIKNLPRHLSTPKHFAYLKIAEGCDNKCTYCIIPKLRGRYRSRSIEELIKEAEVLTKQGVSELILIAQDTTRYGIDLYGEYRLAELLEALDKIKALRWIRIQYMYPDVIDDTLIKTIARLKRVVNYFDIPIQHASDAVLKRMNRNTNAAHIKSVIYSIRKHIAAPVIRTTLIVGFPGETTHDFKTLLDFIYDVKFDRLGAFTYSLEEDTPAYYLKNQLKESDKIKRYEKLMALQQDISEDLQIEKIGNIYEVVIEEKVEEGLYIGRTQLDAPEIDGVCYVRTNGKKLKIGNFVNVKIYDTMEFDTMGDLL